MEENVFGHRPAKPHFVLQAGQRVHIVSGPLAHLTAILVKAEEPSRWLVKIDGLGDGIYATVGENALRRAPDSSAATQ